MDEDRDTETIWSLSMSQWDSEFRSAPTYGAKPPPYPPSQPSSPGGGTLLAVIAVFGLLMVSCCCGMPVASLALISRRPQPPQPVVRLEPMANVERAIQGQNDALERIRARHERSREEMLERMQSRPRAVTGRPAPTMDLPPSGDGGVRPATGAAARAIEAITNHGFDEMQRRQEQEVQEVVRRTEQQLREMQRAQEDAFREQENMFREQEQALRNMEQAFDRVPFGPARRP
jgi:hypothetical protein